MGLMRRSTLETMLDAAVTHAGRVDMNAMLQQLIALVQGNSSLRSVLASFLSNAAHTPTPPPPPATPPLSLDIQVLQKVKRLRKRARVVTDQLEKRRIRERVEALITLLDDSEDDRS